MKKILLLSSITLIGVAQVASAADMRVKAPIAAPVPVLTWTGFYLGVNAGAAWSDRDVGVSGLQGQRIFHAAEAAAALQGLTGTVAIDSTQFLGGGQLGYNIQLAPSIVAGIEADIQGLGRNGGSAATTTAVTANGFPVVTTTEATNRLDWLATLRGRLGVLASPSFLLYATGGLAYGEVSSSISITQAHNNPGLVGDLQTAWGAATSFSDSRTGWTVGVGGEWRIARNWTAKGEYLYYDLGGGSSTSLLLHAADFIAPPTAFTNTANVSTSGFDGHIVRFGVNYLFN